MSEQQIIRARNNDGTMELELRMRGDSLLRHITPYLAQIQALVAVQGNFAVEFDPPIRVENERTREHFWLGTPPLRAVLTPPFLLGVMIATAEEEVIA